MPHQIKFQEETLKIKWPMNGDQDFACLTNQNSTESIKITMQQPDIAQCLWLNEEYQIKGLLKLNPLQFISLKLDQLFRRYSNCKFRKSALFQDSPLLWQWRLWGKRVDLWKVAIISEWHQPFVLKLMNLYFGTWRIQKWWEKKIAHNPVSRDN